MYFNLSNRVVKTILQLILFMFLFSLSACVNVDIVGFVGSVVKWILICIPAIFSFVLGIFFIWRKYFSLQKAHACRLEGIYLVAIIILYFFCIWGPSKLLTNNNDFSYKFIVAVAFIAGLVFAITSLNFRKYDNSLVKPLYSGLFGFILFFLITFGYVITFKEFEKISSIHYLNDTIKKTMFLGQFPYFSFFLAPSTVIIWFFGTIR